MTGPVGTARRRYAALRWCVLILFVLVAVGCGRSVLHSSLNEEQANEVLAELIRNGVDARKSEDKRSEAWQILVPHEQLPAAVAVLHNAGLPRKDVNVAAMFEKKGFVSSPQEEKQRYIYTREQQLQQAFRALDGVVDAYVFLSIPDKDPISDEPVAGSASVLLYVTAGTDLDTRSTDIDKLTTDIKAAVINSTSALKDPTSVSVFTLRRQPRAADLPLQPSTLKASVASIAPLLMIGSAVLAVLVAITLLFRGRTPRVRASGARVIRQGGKGRG